MSTSPVVGFSLRDLLTRVIPGLVIIVPLFVELHYSSLNVFVTGTTGLIIVSLAAFMAGEMVEQLRTGLFRVPFRFSWFIYKLTDDITKIRGVRGRLYQWQQGKPWFLQFYKDLDAENRLENRINFDFREDMESTLKVDFDQDRPREIYDALLIYLDADLTSRTKRLRNLHIFSSNLVISVVMSLGIYSLRFLMFGDGAWLALVFAGISSSIGLMTILSLMASEGLYLELLLKEYWMKQVGLSD